MICCLFYPDNDSDANMLLDTPGNYFFATKKPIHPRQMTGVDRYHACLALQLGKDWNHRTMYAVDVAITRISPGHQQSTKTTFRITHKGH